jgi:hypothetical protein
MGAMLATLAAVAIAVDVGKLLTADSEAQRAADAGALAGASAFIDDPGNAEAVAKVRAKEYSELHTVRHQTVSIVTDEDVQVDLVNFRVDVTVRHISARANPVPTFFARIFGVDDVDVQAHAAAEAVPANAVGCLTPWALADLWQDDMVGGEPGEYDYDDADRSDTPTFGDEFDNYCPCAREGDGLAITSDSDYEFNGLVCTSGSSGTGPGGNCTGFGSDIRGGDVGMELLLKPGNPHQAWNPGWFMAWRPPDDTGGSDYRENIINCISGPFDTESIVPVDIEPGNMIGPTIQGVEARIGDDPHYWEDGCTDGISCVRGPGCGDILANPPQMACSGFEERMITVPLMDPTEVMRNGLVEIQFRGFMRLFLDDPVGNDIWGHLLGVGGTAGSAGVDEGTGAVPLMLRLVD